MDREMININANIVKEAEFLQFEKDDDGNKVYTNCSAYGDKTKDLEN